MHPSTPWLWEQLVAAMREAGSFPISTNDIAARIPVMKVRDACRFSGLSCKRDNHPYISNFTCDGQWHTYDLQKTGFEIYRHLRVFEKRGLCDRVQFNGSRRVLWRPLETPEVASEIAELEELFARS